MKATYLSLQLPRSVPKLIIRCERLVWRILFAEYFNAKYIGTTQITVEIR
jgi:hypothetical protein